MLTIDRSARTTSYPSERALTRPHWSYSQLNGYLRCPLQFFFERVLKLPRQFIPSNMALGSAVHAALADYHQHLQLHQPLPERRLQQTFLSAWGQGESQQPIQFKEGETRDDAIAQGVALLETYLQEPPPENILAVEQAMVVPLHTSSGEFLDKPLVAVVDLLHRGESSLVVSEFKTSGRRYSESEAATTLQASCYVHAVQERFEEPVGVRYVVLVKTKKPAVQYLNTARCDSDLGRLGDIVQSVERAIEAEAFYPIESPMNCSGCAFYKQCREWKGCNSTRSQMQEQTEAKTC
jgi:putative RecB family exonuclease